MTSTDPDSHIKKFEEYTNTFLKRCEKNSDAGFQKKNITLKICHSKRVAALCAEIARSENFSLPLQSTARIAGIYHDIGRFEQFLTYSTFLDTKSVNHAHLGAEILENSDFLSGENDEVRRQIISSTRNHNRQCIDGDFSADELQILKTVRDADKIDILEILCDYHDNREMQKNDALEIDLPDTPGYSHEIITLLLDRQTVPNSLRKNYNDMKLAHLTWVYNLNFRTSLNLFAKKKYAERILAHLPDDKNTRRVRKAISAFIK